MLCAAGAWHGRGLVCASTHNLAMPPNEVVRFAPTQIKLTDIQRTQSGKQGLLSKRCSSSA